MLLKDYISNVDKKYENISFSGISFESSKVKKNNIFFAIKGNKFDGNNYIDAAINKMITNFTTKSALKKSFHKEKSVLTPKPTTCAAISCSIKLEYF